MERRERRVGAHRRSQTSASGQRRRDLPKPARPIKMSDGTISPACGSSFQCAGVFCLGHPFIAKVINLSTIEVDVKKEKKKAPAEPLSDRRPAPIEPGNYSGKIKRLISVTVGPFLFGLAATSTANWSLPVT